MAMDYLYNFPIHINKDISIFSFLYAGDVRFSLNGTIYHNNSIVTLEDIGETDALLCMTNFTVCCQHPHNMGNWFFPNGARVPSSTVDGKFYRTRGQMVVRLLHRGGGVDGIYHCEIPVSTNINQTIFIGVYTANSGELQNNCGVWVWVSSSSFFQLQVSSSSWHALHTCTVLMCACDCTSEMVVL